MLKVTALAILGLAIICASTALSDEPIPPPDRAKEMIAKLDTDGDGFVSKDEFGREDWIFAHLDSNQDGLLSARELSEGKSIPPAPGDPSRPPEPGARRGFGLKQADSDGDGKVSLDEFVEWHKRSFARLDGNGDGFLTPEELRAAARLRGGPQPPTGPGPGADEPRRVAERALKRIDADADGRISRDEWKGAPEGFDRADRNFDGFVDLRELSQMGALLRQRLGQGPEGRREPGRLLKRMDSDGDGAIRRDEFRGGEELFKRLDRNGDGILDLNDLPPAR